MKTNALNFGVFIRTVGERTEKMCYDSCVKAISSEKIHMIKNQYPAAKAYETMFLLAEKYKYDYYLGLDADIILNENWWEIAVKKIKDIVNDNYFVFSFHMYDKFLGKMDRGNHFYNGKYTSKAYFVLNNITKNFLKPESSLEYYIDAKAKAFDDVIGYHGYEQYYLDIYYRFWMQYKRNHSKEIQLKIFNNDFSDDDFIVAQAGWRKSKREIANNILCNRLKLIKISPDHIKKQRFEKNVHKVVQSEKKELIIELSDFYKDRMNEI